MTKVAQREYELTEPGNLVAWMSDELDIKLTLAEERLTQLKSMRQHYLHFRCTSSRCFEQLRNQTEKAPKDVESENGSEELEL